MSAISHLNLSHLYYITDSGLDMLCHLPLKELYLAYTPISMNSVKTLCRMSELEVLSLQYSTLCYYDASDDDPRLGRLISSLDAFIFVKGKCVWSMAEPTSLFQDEEGNNWRDSTDDEHKPARYSPGTSY
jgi:hypothetical protein